MKGEVLLIPDKPDPERDRMAQAWTNRGGEVMRIGKFWQKPAIGEKRVSVYGFDSFCLVLAQVLEIELWMPRDEMIAELDIPFIKRNIEIKTVADIKNIVYPKFIKPVTPKLFKAEIFQSSEELISQIHDLKQEELLICSDTIKVNKEVRSFILDKKIMDLAYYEGSGNLEGPRSFIENFLTIYHGNLPKTFVLDIGYNDQNGWFAIEFNSSWGAGLNFCNPNKVVDCIRAAVIN